jgi:DNA-binding response OmpR family regulator
MDRPPTILLMDEDADSLKSIRNALHERGYRVFCARNAGRGLEMADRIAPHLVVTSVLLPGMSGFRVVELTKRRNPSCRIIMLAEVGGTAQSNLAQFLGADEFLRKPISMNRLLDSITRLCPLPVSRPHEAIAGPHLHKQVGVHDGP